MTDNVAVLAGFTKEVFATSDFEDLCLLIKPDTDLDSMFKAWDMDGQEWVFVAGWAFTFEEVPASGTSTECSVGASRSERGE